MKSTTREALDTPPPVPSVPNPMEHHQTNGNTDHTEQVDAEEEGEDTRQPNSPLLTSHRISSSSLDNVSLDEDSATTKPISSPSKGMLSFSWRQSQYLTLPRESTRFETPSPTQNPQGIAPRILRLSAIHTLVASPATTTTNSNIKSPTSRTTSNQKINQPFLVAFAEYLTT
jgi:hypothetical protein